MLELFQNLTIVWFVASRSLSPSVKSLRDLGEVLDSMAGSLARWSPGDHRGHAVFSNLKLFLHDNSVKLNEMHSLAPSLIKQWEFLQHMLAALDCVSTPGVRPLQVESDVPSESGPSSGGEEDDPPLSPVPMHCDKCEFGEFDDNEDMHHLDAGDAVEAHGEFNVGDHAQTMDDGEPVEAGGVQEDMRTQECPLCGLASTSGFSCHSRNNCLKTAGVRCCRRWRKQRAAGIRALVGEVLEGNIPHPSIDLVTDLGAMCLRASMEAMTISSHLADKPEMEAYCSAIQFSSNLLSKAAMDVTIALAEGQVGEGVSPREQIEQLLEMFTVLLRTVANLLRSPSSPPGVGHGEDYRCSSCLRPRSERKVHGCCFHQGGQRCRQLQLKHEREEQEAQLNSTGNSSFVCSYCYRPASHLKKAGHCFRPSTTHPQSQLCRNLQAQLQTSSAIPELEVERTTLCPHCALPVKSFRLKGCCSRPGSTRCQERRRRREDMCHDVEKPVDSRPRCQFCQRPVTNATKLGGCYRPAGSTKRSRTCIRRERDIRRTELLPDSEQISGGLCIYCELPFSKLKRRGCCSSIAGVSGPKSKCLRLHLAALARVERDSSMRASSFGDYRRQLIRSLLSNMDGVHLSDATTTAFFSSPQRNIFITGPAGTGKTVDLLVLCDYLLQHFSSEPNAVALTASTGVAASAIGGVTFHSYFGLGSSGGVGVVNRWFLWKQLKVLVVDEISMLDAAAFVQASNLLRRAKCCGDPFAGVRVIVVGDFAQLPTVHVGTDPRPPPLFDHDLWMSCNFEVVYLNQMRRCVDHASWRVLQEVRLHQPHHHRLSGASVAFLRSLIVHRRGPTSPTSASFTNAVTHLFARRAPADAFNLKMLSELPGEEVVFSASDHFKALGDCSDHLDLDLLSLTQRLDKGVLARPSLILKEGALVVLISNVYRERHPCLTKGVTGRVCHINFNLGCPLVVQVLFHLPNPYGNITLEITDDAEFSMLSTQQGVDVLCTRRSLPLLLGYGLTIHLCQGMTLAAVRVDLSDIFESGQAYVALSRTRSLRDVSLTAFDQSKLRCHNRVREYYLALEAAAAPAHATAASNLASMSTDARVFTSTQHARDVMMSARVEPMSHAMDEAVEATLQDGVVYDNDDCYAGDDNDASAPEEVEQADAPATNEPDERPQPPAPALFRIISLYQKALQQMQEELSVLQCEANSLQSSTADASSIMALKNDISRCESDMIYHKAQAQESRELRTAEEVVIDSETGLPLWLVMAAEACVATLHNPGPSTGGHGKCMAECLAILEMPELLHQGWASASHRALLQRETSRAEDELPCRKTRTGSLAKPQLHLLDQVLSLLGLCVGLLECHTSLATTPHAWLLGNTEEAPNVRMDMLLVYDVRNTHLLLIQMRNADHLLDFLDLLSLDSDMSTWPHAGSQRSLPVASILDQVALGRSGSQLEDHQVDEADVSDLSQFNEYLASVVCVWASHDGRIHFHSHGGRVCTPAGLGVLTFGNGLFVMLDLEMPAAADFDEKMHFIMPGYCWPRLNEVHHAAMAEDTSGAAAPTALATRRLIFGTYHVDNNVVGQPTCHLVADAAREYDVVALQDQQKVVLTATDDLRRPHRRSDPSDIKFPYRVSGPPLAYGIMRGENVELTLHRAKKHGPGHTLEDYAVIFTGSVSGNMRTPFARFGPGELRLPPSERGLHPRLLRGVWVGDKLQGLCYEVVQQTSNQDPSGFLECAECDAVVPSRRKSRHRCHQMGYSTFSITMELRRRLSSAQKRRHLQSNRAATLEALARARSKRHQRTDEPAAESMMHDSRHQPIILATWEAQCMITPHHINEIA